MLPAHSAARLEAPLSEARRLPVQIPSAALRLITATEAIGFSSHASSRPPGTPANLPPSNRDGLIKIKVWELILRPNDKNLVPVEADVGTHTYLIEIKDCMAYIS